MRRLRATWDSLPLERRILLIQLVRYVITGGFVTAAQAAVYYALAKQMGLHPQAANFIAFLFAVCLGFVLHSRWSFAGHGSRDNVAALGGRFAVVQLASLATNAFWVWLLIDFARLPLWSPIPAMLFVTPLLIFTLNRRWVFR